jgi:hypothetical protein
MSDKINIQEILKKYGERFANLYQNKEEFRTAIKEIVEAVVDKCGDHMALTLKNGQDTPKKLVPIQRTIDEVKQMIDYE